MENKTTLILFMATVAGMILWKRRKQLLESDDPAFREGYFAGFLTPGPFTILALTGYAIWAL